MQSFFQTLVSGLSFGAVYALVALGFSLVYRTMGLVNFAHGAVLMIGAYVASTFYLSDRLPFAVPSDPVVAARMRAIEEDGRSAFFEYQVPQAVITLKQGFGRLIRSLEDRGVLMLLDPRLQRQRYGRVFMESLPPYRVTKDIAEVEAFFAD